MTSRTLRRGLALGVLLLPVAVFAALPPAFEELPAAWLRDQPLAIATRLRQEPETRSRFLRLFRTTPGENRDVLLRRFRQAVRVAEDPAKREILEWMLGELLATPPTIVRYLKVCRFEEAAYNQALRASEVREHYRGTRGLLRRRTHLILSGAAAALDALVAAAGLDVEAWENIDGLQVLISYRNTSDVGNPVFQLVVKKDYDLLVDIREGLTWLDWLTRDPMEAICHQAERGDFEVPYREYLSGVGRIRWETRILFEPEPFASGTRRRHTRCEEPDGVTHP